METDELRTIEELLTLYVVEPSLVDVFVEGRSDASLIGWYLREHNTQCRVFPIDDRVYVPREVTVSISEETSSRVRLIALAHAFAELDPKPAYPICIIDADYDYFLDRKVETSRLLYTDYSSIECYALTPKVFGKFLQVVLHRDPAEGAANLLKSLLQVMVQIALLRISLQVLDYNIGLIERFDSCCVQGPDGFEVDLLELVKKSVNSLPIDPVIAMIEELRAKGLRDPRKVVRGHDAARIIIKMLRLKNDFAKVEVVERSLIGCIERSDLDREQMFIVLRDGVAPIELE